MELTQIDDYVAEYVMGWRRGTTDKRAWERKYDASRWGWAGWLAVDPVWVPNGTGDCEQDPSRVLGTKRFAPTTDIVACKLVTDVMIARGDFYLERSQNEWFAMFGDDLGNAVVAPTETLARSLAALKVAGMDIDVQTNEYPDS